MKDLAEKNRTENLFWKHLEGNIGDALCEIKDAEELKVFKNVNSFVKSLFKTKLYLSKQDVKNIHNGSYYSIIFNRNIFSNAFNITKLASKVMSNISSIINAVNRKENPSNSYNQKLRILTQKEIFWEHILELALDRDNLEELLENNKELIIGSASYYLSKYFTTSSLEEIDYKLKKAMQYIPHLTDAEEIRKQEEKIKKYEERKHLIKISFDSYFEIFHENLTKLFSSKLFLDILANAQKDENFAKNIAKLLEYFFKNHNIEEFENILKDPDLQKELDQEDKAAEKRRFEEVKSQTKILYESQKNIANIFTEAFFKTQSESSNDTEPEIKRLLQTIDEIIKSLSESVGKYSFYPNIVNIAKNVLNIPLDNKEKAKNLAVQVTNIFFQQKQDLLDNKIINFNEIINPALEFLLDESIINSVNLQIYQTTEVEGNRQHIISDQSKVSIKKFAKTISNLIGKSLYKANLTNKGFDAEGFENELNILLFNICLNAVKNGSLNTELANKLKNIISPILNNNIEIKQFIYNLRELIKTSGVLPVTINEQFSFYLTDIIEHNFTDIIFQQYPQISPYKDDLTKILNSILKEALSNKGAQLADDCLSVIEKIISPDFTEEQKVSEISKLINDHKQILGKIYNNISNVPEEFVRDTLKALIEKNKNSVSEEQKEILELAGKFAEPLLIKILNKLKAVNFTEIDPDLLLQTEKIISVLPKIYSDISRGRLINTHEIEKISDAISILCSKPFMSEILTEEDLLNPLTDIIHKLLNQINGKDEDYEASRNSLKEFLIGLTKGFFSDKLNLMHLLSYANNLYYSLSRHDEMSIRSTLNIIDSSFQILMNENTAKNIYSNINNLDAKYKNIIIQILIKNVQTQLRAAGLEEEYDANIQNIIELVLKHITSEPENYLSSDSIAKLNQLVQILANSRNNNQISLILLHLHNFIKSYPPLFELLSDQDLYDNVMKVTNKASLSTAFPDSPNKQLLTAILNKSQFVIKYKENFSEALLKLSELLDKNNKSFNYKALGGLFAEIHDMLKNEDKDIDSFLELFKHGSATRKNMKFILEKSLNGKQYVDIEKLLTLISNKNSLKRTCHLMQMVFKPGSMIDYLKLGPYTLYNLIIDSKFRLLIFGSICKNIGIFINEHLLNKVRGVFLDGIYNKILEKAENSQTEKEKDIDDKINFLEEFKNAKLDDTNIFSKMFTYLTKSLFSAMNFNNISFSNLNLTNFTICHNFSNCTIQNTSRMKYCNIIDSDFSKMKFSPDQKLIFEKCTIDLATLKKFVESDNIHDFEFKECRLTYKPLSTLEAQEMINLVKINDLDYTTIGENIVKMILLNRKFFKENPLMTDAKKMEYREMHKEYASIDLDDLRNELKIQGLYK